MSLQSSLPHNQSVSTAVIARRSFVASRNADFVAELGDTAGEIFTEVLLECQRQNLIGQELFAIDGVKLPSNASKARSGSRKDFQRQARKIDKAVKTMLARHRSHDSQVEREEDSREAQKLAALQQEAATIRRWLRTHPDDKRSGKGKVRLSNRTDNDSAKMATDKGVIQGYTGVAAVDAKAQIVVQAHAHGSGSEQDALLVSVDEAARWRTAETMICTDAGYHSEENLEALDERGIDAYICDNGYRKRDLRYNKWLTRFTLRGRTKVDSQWKLYCLVHNIEKLAHHGYGE